MPPWIFNTAISYFDLLMNCKYFEFRRQTLLYNWQVWASPERYILFHFFQHSLQVLLKIMELLNDMRYDFFIHFNLLIVLSLISKYALAVGVSALQHLKICIVSKAKYGRDRLWPSNTRRTLTGLDYIR